MNKKLQNILTLLEQNKNLTAEEKESVLKSLNEADKELEITAFKLERTEKVKKTTAILLEETIEELEQKRKAVEAQNRELEIEASLERIRAIAMSMHKAEGLLDVVEILNTELKMLGFTDIRNTIINIFNDTKQKFLNYDYSDYGVGGISEVDYNSHPSNKKFVNKMREASKDFMITEFTGNELDEWRKWRIAQGQMPDSKLDQAESLYYYEFSIGVGSIGISTFSPISEDQLEVLKRFRNVFKLSYQRYVDITLAEAQAREAQIELALERVRARTMGMQRSEELKEVIQVVYEQFVHLNIHIEHTGFIMDYKARDDMHIWLADRHDVPFEVTIPYFDCAHWNSFIEAKEKGIDFFANHLTFEEKNKFYQDLFKLIPGVPKETLEYYFSCPSLAISTVLLENVGLYIENFSGIPYTDEENNTLMRFGKVFQQTYTRFNDLKQAEAQAREAQIENALEKVRSRTMAMQKSEELSETAKVFFEQMHALGELPDRIGINIIKEDEKLFEIWATNQDGSNLDHRFRATIEEPTSYSKLYAAWKAKKDYIIIDLKGQELKKWIKFVREKIKMTVDDKNIKGRRIHNATFFSNGVLLCTTHEPVKDEVIKLLVRFAKVFDQTYRRFLDLQKAEAQARESQIEAALERVRSKTMAMHNSHDVGATVVTLFDEVLKLGLDKSIRVGIGILEGNEHMETWSATSSSKGKVDLKMGMLDMTIHPMLIGLKKAWESGETGYSYDYIGDDVFRYYEALNNEPDYPFQANLDSLPENEYHKSFFYKEGILFSFAPNPISDESAKVLNRFAGVFGQTYRRYLDLQKAEAQAREAQIEAALERVRTNAMAMQTSDDLAKIVEIVFTELKKVGFETIRCGIGIIESAETKKVDIWSTTLADENLSIQISGDEVLEGHALLDGIIEHWVNQTEFSHVLEGDEFLKYYQTIEKTNFHLPDFAQKNLSKDERQYYYMVPCKAGGIYAFSIVPFTVEVKKLMRRFIEVFQLAYTRYVDLQKAESQARESQIQLALERVRARTMAMHKSDELAETAAVLFQQMKELGVTPERLNICLINEETNNLEVWSTDQEGFKINHHFNANLEEPTTGAKVYKAWKEKKKSLIIELSGQELNDWIKYVREVMGMTIKEELIKERRIHSVAFFSHGMILTTTPEPLPDESMNLQERFADVFNLTYRRFLDLKNAEAQTREAQIEASLERVRSKAMSMHSPNDLSETVNVFFKELKTLGIIPIRCGVGQIDEATRTTSLTTTTSSQQGDSFEVIGKVKQTGHPVLDGIFDHWKMQKEYHPVLEGVDIKAYYDVMNAQIAYPDYREDVTQYGNNFYFKEGFIFAWTESKLSEEELQIFRRFTSVLSLTYRRYIDLKAAEIRAFDAIKQASLDRVRAEIASMRSTEDLNRITPIIWRELKTLEVPFFRCGVFIVDQGKAKVQVYLTTPDGKSLGVLNLSFDSNELTSKTVEYWRKKKVYKEHWDKKEFISWSKSMIELGQIQNTETYQGSANPPESLYLHFVPFEQGMLYVGDTSSLSEEKIELVKSLAESFSIAYSRYEDFERLEAAKMEVESAFGELDILSKELKIKNEELENENQRKAIELEEARQLQLSMLPKELPKLPNLDIAVYMKTATEVGGDYYDFNVGVDGTLTVAIGDATGHGMKAGTIVSMIKALFASGGSRMDMKSYFKESSDALKGIELGRLMMAFLMLRINSHKLQFANAGMPPLFIYRNRLKEVEEMMIHGMPLGAVKDFPYEISEIEISSGDTILLLSDGLPELKNERSQQYGYTQVKEKFMLAAEKSPDEIVEYLKNSAAEWINGVEPDDDVTFVLIKIK